VVWAVGLVPPAAADSLLRAGARLLAWGHDPAGLVRGGGAFGASVGLGSASVLALVAWLAGVRIEKGRRSTGRSTGTRHTGSGRTQERNERRD
jgi:hypothetical protein